MADEMEAGAGLAQVLERRYLRLGFLDLVLAELAQPGGERLAYGCGGEGLAHGHELDLRRLATRPRRRPFDPVADVGEALPHHFLGLR